MNSILKKVTIFCFAFIFILGTCQLASAQLTANPLPVARIPMMGKIVHAGAVQIGPPADDVCPLPGIKADTYLTIVNPAETFFLTCPSAISPIPRWWFVIEGYVVVFDSNGNPVGKTRFKVPPKGNATVSLAQIILQNDTRLDLRLKKYTYDIIWFTPVLANELKEYDCRPPFIPISVEVKEIMFTRWLCADEVPRELDILLYNTDFVLSWSETILDRSNIIFPILREVVDPTQPQ